MELILKRLYQIMCAYSDKRVLEYGQGSVVFWVGWQWTQKPMKMEEFKWERMQRRRGDPHGRRNVKQVSPVCDGGALSPFDKDAPTWLCPDFVSAPCTFAPPSLDTFYLSLCHGRVQLILIINLCYDNKLVKCLIYNFYLCQNFHFRIQLKFIIGSVSASAS
ncbi:Uncharacterized protein TCM_021926 [Theobroma cacao]|uniref:Uncharacterized protein n=1 Tax=Theobroma cacao TaxID=3641 RepID=A0A061ES56_THECC|nr:Uncharacterized protein TCM_021926 [Theobroma cacao]